ncbi:Metallo-peptidase family M12-domain-containing protein [Aspergillus avenaceus]|uniref:Disintegrin and metalloproteinase domain-containing protein B n=1 Tax=Aspergillus avenaceus TaxID=36643 RepID=A0A5N6U0F1_ASPAV|nr:Metallo-peptidase family M12-domain-containing protein [Aspergillus avenaceus]
MLTLSAHSIHFDDLADGVELRSVVINTPSHIVTPHSSFNVSLTLPGQGRGILLRLVPNDDILRSNPQVRFMDHNGLIDRSEILHASTHKVFKGEAWIEGESHTLDKVGWARIYIVRDGDHPLLDGLFSVSSRLYEIKVASESNMQKRQMMIYASSTSSSHQSARAAKKASCGSDRLLSDHIISGNDTRSLLTDSTSALGRRQSTTTTDDLIASIGSTSGCPNSRRMALVGIATDCTYTASFNSTEELRRSLISMVNTASEVFERTFNVALGLRNLTISDSACPDSASSSVPWNAACSEGDMQWRLQRFTSWRRALGDRQNAYWTLMTGCPSGSEVGVSWVGELCSPDSSTNVVARASNQWQVFAHESGHTFGAVHDCDESTCSSGTECCPLSSSTCNAGAQYLMNPASSSSQTEFSPCTIGNVCSFLGSRTTNTNCLVENNTVPTITEGECGNGIVEVGENCDCGDNCDDNDCCDGSTCRFRDNAVCDDSTGPCCTNCQFATSGTVCRQSIGTCDIEETCTGSSGSCPTDRHLPDGQNCNNSTSMFCATGECTNRDMQCRDLLTNNSTGVSSCNNDSCSLSCTIDSYGSGLCMNMNQRVRDGMPCAEGSCRSGRCQQDNARDGSWVDEHLPLVIGLSAGVGGGLIVAVLLVVIICCCCRRRQAGKNVPSTPNPVTSQMPSQQPNPPTNSEPPPHYRYA